MGRCRSQTAELTDRTAAKLTFRGFSQKHPVRDRAILATLLYHGIRREELCLLRLRDVQSRQGVMHFRIKGKPDKIRFVPVHPMVLRLIGEYLEAGKHGGAVTPATLDSPLLPPVTHNPTW